MMKTSSSLMLLPTTNKSMSINISIPSNPLYDSTNSNLSYAETSSSVPFSYASSPGNPPITLTVWNANGLDRESMSIVTDTLHESSLIFITETWLKHPRGLHTTWDQHHTYGVPVSSASDTEDDSDQEESDSADSTTQEATTADVVSQEDDDNAADIVSQEDEDNAADVVSQEDEGNAADVAQDATSRRRGPHRDTKMGISLLVNPACPYNVTFFESSSPHVLSCQVSNILIHCLYLPPSLSDDDCFDILQDLPQQTHPSQTKTLLCGDFNARSQAFLGDTRTHTRGVRLEEWISDNGLYCWNALLARGVPTLCSPSRTANALTGSRSWNSIVDLWISYGDLLEPQLHVRGENMRSDHLPVSLSFRMDTPPPPKAPHPRLLWKLNLLDHGNPKQLYESIFDLKIFPLKRQLLAEVKYSIDTYLQRDSTSATHYLLNHLGDNTPDVDSYTDKLNEAIHYSLDHSVGRQKPPRPRGNAWFWTDTLQSLVNARQEAFKVWRHSPDGITKGLRWKSYMRACARFDSELHRRKRETWKQFCDKLSNGPITDTTGTIHRLLRKRRTVNSNSFQHPEGPEAAASAMSSHLRSVFAGDNLPPTRPTAPLLPTGPNLTLRYIHYLNDTFDLQIASLPPVDDGTTTSAAVGADCPFTVDIVKAKIREKLARRKAPGVDHLRTEMLLPIVDKLAPVLLLLFSLCWIWSKVPKVWCTAQVIPIHKKGDPTDAANYRPISLTSVLRKLLELCLSEQLLETGPPLDIVQGGFRANRGTLDQALALHELCRQHTVDHMGEPPILCFLDIKQAYDSVDRNIIWRALETHVPDALLGILQCLFDHVHIEALVSGARSPTFWPGTGVLQGSILSPYLYSVFINSLPSALRTVRPPGSRLFDNTPPRKYNGLWINSLLYADDVVLIGTFETMPRLLKMVERHSMELGYRWNPLKCVVVNSPPYVGATPLKLYGTPIPCADSFNYLGLPFNADAQLDATLLAQHNARSALVAMRTGLQTLGIYSPSFSRLTAARLYSTFIRPKLEYGLAIVANFTAKERKVIENAQDQCLRICFGGHRASSTSVFKHLTNLPSMAERIANLQLKLLVRLQDLPEDTLLGSLRTHILSTSKYAVKFRWPKLLETNAILNLVSPRLPSDPTTRNLQQPLQRWLTSDGDIKKAFKLHREDVLDTIANSRDPPVLLMACRLTVGLVDPILCLPMTIWERSRLLRWKMGWIGARPKPCRCGHPHASRNHLLDCLAVANRLNVAPDSEPNPLDFVLNQLPKLKSPPSANDQRYQQSLIRWASWWPTICAILLEMEIICLPEDTVLSPGADDTQGKTFLKWLLPVYFVQVAPSIRSTLYNYL